MSIRFVRVFFSVLALFGAGSFAVSAPIAFAQDANTAEVAAAAGFGNADLFSVIGTIISVLLGILGVLFLVLVIYAGFTWMTAAGDEKKVASAKQMLINAVIGLLIVLGAYAITTFVVNLISDATGTGRSNGAGSNGVVSIERLSGALGSGSITDHFPRRNATDVARNTRIMVTFRSSMDIASFIEGYDTSGTPLDTSDDEVATALKAENILIYPSADGESAALTDVTVAFSEDLKSFVFTPAVFLGSATENKQYIVALQPVIKSATGDAVFTGANDEGYEWSFTTGTKIDVTPPSIRTVTPVAGAQYDRNIAVQVTFDEPIDPTSATGVRTISSGFQNLTIRGAATQTGPTGSENSDSSSSQSSGLGGALSSNPPIPGEYKISNGYQTVTFISTDPCGTNSCGETIYCLPSRQDLTVTVNAPTIGSSPPLARDFPYDGIVDMSGNGLDGNNDGDAGDDYAWGFSTSGNTDLSAPSIVSIAPNISEGEVELDRDIEVTFDDVLMSDTVSSENIFLMNKEVVGDTSHEQWYRFDVGFLTAGNEEVLSTTMVPTQTRVSIPHGTFLESVDGKSYRYGIEVTQGVRNQYQNCYVPAGGPNGSGGACAVSAEKPYCCNGVSSSSACSLF